MKDIFKACLNWKVLIGIGVVILLLYLFVPQIASYSWVLFVLICPLSMIMMMSSMDHSHDKPEKLFVCPECGFGYNDAGWAKKCAAWCKEHKSCNADIIKFAVSIPTK